MSGLADHFGKIIERPTHPTPAAGARLANPPKSEPKRVRLKHWILNQFTDASGATAVREAQEPEGRARAAFAARVEFENVGRQFGDVTAIHDVSLTIEPGEVVCLLGPSGCGKTTLLRIASGIERPTSGRVLINGREVAGPSNFIEPEKRSVGLMFQDFALFPHLSIIENVTFGLNGLPYAEARHEALAVLKRVGLQEFATAYPHTLSGGQQQRVALARAIVPRPSVMLMDEPFSGLDVQLRDAMQEETLRLLKETRATCIIVTHHPEEAMRLGDRIAVMHQGRLMQVGKAEDLYHHPAALFVGRLFSEINEIEFKVKGGEIDTPLGRFPVDGVADGKMAVMCIRERGIALLSPDEMDRGAGPLLPGRILSVKFLGDVAHVEVGVVGVDEPLMARVPESPALVKGGEVTVEIDLARVLVFPQTETERH